MSRRLGLARWTPDKEVTITAITAQSPTQDHAETGSNTTPADVTLAVPFRHVYGSDLCAEFVQASRQRRMQAPST